MKILVVRVGRAGDMVMITSALNALFDRYREAEITLLTSPDGRRVLRDFNPRLSDTWILNRKKIFPFIERHKLKKAIRQANFAHIYCFETKASFGKLFTGSDAKKHMLSDSKNSEINFAERCLHLVDPSFSRKQFPVFLPVKEDAEKRALSILEQAGISSNTFLVGIHPSYSGLGKKFGRNKKSFPHRNWTIERWGELCRNIRNYAAQKNTNIQIIMDLMPEEKPLGEAVTEASENSVKLLTPPPDFERYKATLARMDLLIAPNTGPMHVAAAVGTNIVSMFSIHNPADCAPYTDKKRMKLLRAENFENSQDGLSAITADAVFQACKAFLP